MKCGERFHRTNFGPLNLRQSIFCVPAIEHVGIYLARNTLCKRAGAFKVVRGTRGSGRSTSEIDGKVTQKPQWLELACENRVFAREMLTFY